MSILKALVRSRLKASLVYVPFCHDPRDGGGFLSKRLHESRARGTRRLRRGNLLFRMHASKTYDKDFFERVLRLLRRLFLIQGKGEGGGGGAITDWLQTALSLRIAFRGIHV